MPSYEGIEVSEEVLEAIPAFFGLLGAKCGASPTSGLEVKMAVHCLSEVVAAARMGRSLMESNTELSEKYTTTVNSYAQEIDTLNERIHVLQSDLKHSERHRQSISADNERAVEKLQQEKQEREANLELRKRDIAQLKADAAQSDTKFKVQIDELELVNKQHVEKIERLQISIQQQKERALKDIVCGSRNTENAENAFEQLQAEYTTVSSELDRTNSELEESLQIIERLELAVQNATDRCESLEAHVAEKDEEIESMYAVVSESRQQITQLQDKADTTDGLCETVNSKSILSELEDARAETERQLQTVTAKYDARKRVHDALKQQYMRLQETMTTALQLNANRANTAVVERLQQTLSQREGEIHSLRRKLVRAEEAQANQVYGNALKEAFNKQKTTGDVYVSYLEAQVNVQSRLEKDLRKELEMVELKLVSEANRVRDTQAALGREESKATQLAAEVVRLKLSNSDLKMRLEDQTVVATVETNTNIISADESDNDRDKENQAGIGRKKRRISNVVATATDSTKCFTEAPHDVRVSGMEHDQNRDENYCGPVDTDVLSTKNGSVHTGASEVIDNNSSYLGTARRRRIAVTKQPTLTNDRCNQQ